MSSDDRPGRRRIAGESSPSAGRPTPAGPRVVRKPVRRPGANPPKDTTPPEDVGPKDSDELEDPAVEDDSTAVEERGDYDVVADPSVADEPASDPSNDDEDDTDTASPRVVPAGRFPRRRGSRTEQDGAARDGSSVDRDAASARPGRLRRVLPVLVAVLALAFAGAAGYWAYGQVRGATGVGSAQTEAESAATKAAEQILSYRYDQLDEHLEKSQELMTPDFGEEFETISPALNDLAPQRQIVVEATAREAAPMPCGDDCSTDEADVLVFVDQARVADGEEQPTVFGNRITLSMVHEGGQWLVDDIEAY